MRWAIFAAVVSGFTGWFVAAVALGAGATGWALTCPSIPIALLIDHYKNLDNPRFWDLIMNLNGAIYGTVAYQMVRRFPRR